MTRQDIVRQEWRIVVKTAFGNKLTEWASTEDQAQKIQDRYLAKTGFTIVSVEFTDHLLDF